MRLYGCMGYLRIKSRMRLPTECVAKVLPWFYVTKYDNNDTVYLLSV